MQGWIIPPPKEPINTKAEFCRKREKKAIRLARDGYLKSDRIIDAVLEVQREDFIPVLYRDSAYFEVPLPLPWTVAYF